MDLVIAQESPRSVDVVALLEAHLAFAASQSPPEHVHALDLDGLCHPSVSFFAARRAGELLGVGALKLLDPGRAELKSMHTAVSSRGQGVGRALVEHLIAHARANGCHWLGLETGAGEAFSPAHRLYAAAGFVDCDPFGSYTRNPWSRCMELSLSSLPACGR